MTSQTITLEPFDGISPAAIHEPPDESETAKKAEAAAELEAKRLVAEAKLNADAAHHAELISELRGISALTSAHRLAAVRALSQTIGDAAHAMFPAMTEKGFAEEVAVAVAEVLMAAELPKARLKVAAADHDRIVAALEALAPRKEILVVNDPDLPPGRAELVWAGGGADFDTSQLVEIGTRQIERNVQRLLRNDSNE